MTEPHAAIVVTTHAQQHVHCVRCHPVTVLRACLYPPTPTMVMCRLFEVYALCVSLRLYEPVSRARCPRPAWCLRLSVRPAARSSRRRLEEPTIHSARRRTHAHTLPARQARSGDRDRAHVTHKEGGDCITDRSVTKEREDSILLVLPSQVRSDRGAECVCSKAGEDVRGASGCDPIWCACSSWMAWSSPFV